MDWSEPEYIDLKRVAECLQDLFRNHPPTGYLDGKTEMRNALEDKYGVSELDAEEMVDTLETRGYVRFEGDPATPTDVETVWAIESRREE